MSSLKTKLINKLKNIVLLSDSTPEQMALSFAIGFSIACNPFIGLHTVIAIASCIIFKNLYKPLIILGCYINNPWTMLPIASISIFIGNVFLNLFSTKRDLYTQSSSIIKWHDINLHNLTNLKGLIHILNMLKPIIIPYVIGGFIIGLLAIPLGYYIMIKVIRQIQKKANIQHIN